MSGCEPFLPVAHCQPSVGPNATLELFLTIASIPLVVVSDSTSSIVPLCQRTWSMQGCA